MVPEICSALLRMLLLTVQIHHLLGNGKHSRSQKRTTKSSGFAWSFWLDFQGSSSFRRGARRQNERLGGVAFLLCRLSVFEGVGFGLKFRGRCHLTKKVSSIPDGCFLGLKIHDALHVEFYPPAHHEFWDRKCDSLRPQ